MKNGHQKRDLAQNDENQRLERTLFCYLFGLLSKVSCLMVKPAFGIQFNKFTNLISPAATAAFPECTAVKWPLKTTTVLVMTSSLWNVGIPMARDFPKALDVTESLLLSSQMNVAYVQSYSALLHLMQVSDNFKYRNSCALLC